MFNPEIIKKSGPCEAQEGCLSLPGVRRARRWKAVKAQYRNEKFQTRFKTFTGRTARIIRHEIDRREGILIGAENGPADFNISLDKSKYRSTIQ